MEPFDTAFIGAWSIGAIVLGLYMLVKQEDFISQNIRGLNKWSEKTGLRLFARQAEQFKSRGSRLLVTLLGVAFIVIGLLKLYETALTVF